MASFRSDRAKKPYNVSYPLFLDISQSHLTISQRPEPRVVASDGMWLHDKAPGAPRAANQANGHIKVESSLNSKLIVSNLHYEITPKDLTV
jgi:hypothetical protein